MALDGFLVQRSPMSLRLPQPVPPVPDDTARIARAAFPRGNPYLLLRDRLGPVFDDAGFADLYPRRGQPGYTPWRLALVTLLQFREGLSDRQAAEAVRARIDWKYLLALDLADAGFDYTVLCEFRARLLAGGAAEHLLARMLDVAHEAGLIKARGRQRTDSTHVLAAVRALNRLELVAETLRAALNAIAGVAPDWLRALAPPGGTTATTGVLRTGACPGPNPSATPMWPRSEQTAFSCSMQSTGPRHRLPSPRCPRLPCCAGCGRATLSGRRPGQTRVRSAGTRCDSGRRRAVAPATASSPLTTARPAFGPRPAPAGPATWFT